jgi:hypothetical protein
MKLDVGGPCDYDVTKKEFQMCKVWVFQNLTSQHKIYRYSMSARSNVSMVGTRPHSRSNVRTGRWNERETAFK